MAARNSSPLRRRLALITRQPPARIAPPYTISPGCSFRRVSAFLGFRVPILIIASPGSDDYDPGSAITTGSLFGLGSPFLSGVPGFTRAPGVLGGTGMSVGIAPNAAPFGAPATSTSPGTFTLCANLPREGNGLQPVQSVAAFYSIGNDGEVRLLAPLAPGVPMVCPAGL